MRVNLLADKMIHDVVLADGGHNYYGYLNHKGAWVIMREDTAETQYRYAIGNSGYTAAFVARTSQTYVQVDEYNTSI